jgi:hypothetical protein
VHRGTSWQTVYLKASDALKQIQVSGGGSTATTNYVGTNNWMAWTGNGNTSDAINACPVEDRLLFDVFTTALNDNASRGTLSVNQTNLAAWSAVFSGVQVLSNNLSNAKASLAAFRQYQYPPPAVTNLFIEPVGPWTVFTNAALGKLVDGINKTRDNTNLFPQQTFTHVGDIIRVPQFTERSPFLNWTNIAQQTNGISDELYEWLPQQVMSLLRCASSPRYVIYCYGQALKPAPNGVYSGGEPYFQMITNYQVVSETATRAVVRFDSLRTNTVAFWTTNIGLNTYTNWYNLPVVTNNHAVIEQFNILPPD